MKYCWECENLFNEEIWKCPQCGYEPDIIDGFPSFLPEAAYMNDGFISEDHDLLMEVEKGHFWFENRNRLLIWVLKEYFPEAHNFCEIGCGTGFVLEGISKSFPRINLYASDIYSRSLLFANSRVPDAVMFQTDLCKVPFKDEFDVVGTFDVLEHIEKDECALCNLYNSIKPGGGAILTVPQHMWLWSAQDERGCHKRRYVKNDLVSKMINVGFEVIRATSFMSLLLPVLIISRSQKKDARKLNDATELHIKPFINWVLGVICSIERRMIKSGVYFPIGGSLLVVARKNGK